MVAKKKRRAGLSTHVSNTRKLLVSNIDTLSREKYSLMFIARRVNLINRGWCNSNSITNRIGSIVNKSISGESWFSTNVVIDIKATENEVKSSESDNVVKETVVKRAKHRIPQKR